MVARPLVLLGLRHPLHPRQQLLDLDPSETLRETMQRLVLDSGAIFSDEGRAVIREERRVRDYGNYNAILQAIARGNTKLEDIRERAGTGHATLDTLERLMAFSWVAHETPFQQPNRRGFYRITDNFLLFWYGFVFPNRSALPRLRPATFWRTFIEPELDARHMGQGVFERLCQQYLDRFGESRGLIIREMGRCGRRTTTPRSTSWPSWIAATCARNASGRRKRSEQRSSECSGPRSSEPRIRPGRRRCAPGWLSSHWVAPRPN